MSHDCATDCPDESSSSALAPLGREEYVEQAHFFSGLAERLQANIPAQEILGSLREEVLATTRLPMAIDFLLAELRHEGVFGPGMVQLRHYFTPFQAYVIREAENERSRFDLRVGLQILGREAQYRAATPTREGIFLYQFESLCRNRLGYDRGLEAVAADPAFDTRWREWIESIRRQVGMVDIADLIYVNSAHYTNRQGAAGRAGRRAGHNQPAPTSSGTGEMPGAAAEDSEEAARVASAAPLFGEREGRIALANRRKDPLFLFASLHRQLGYPEVPLPARPDEKEALLPQLARRVELMEKRLSLVEEEQRGGVDLTQFYGPQGD